MDNYPDGVWNGDPRAPWNEPEAECPWCGAELDGWGECPDCGNEEECDGYNAD